MIKRFFALLMIIMVAIFTLSACTLVDNIGNGKNANGVFKEDYLVGVMVYTRHFENDEMHFFPSKDFKDDSALRFFYEEKHDKNEPYVVINKGNQNPAFFDPKFVITNHAAAPNGKVKIDAKLYYTYELLGSGLVLAGIYQAKNYEYYMLAESITEYGNTAYMLNKVNTTLSMSQKMEIKNAEGETLTYEGNFSIDINFTDYLINAKIVEFDESHNVVKSENYKVAEMEENTDYEASKACAYAFLEEEYEVKDTSASNYGEKYTTRTLINRSNQKQYFMLKAPQGNGLVYAKAINMTFAA